MARVTLVTDDCQRKSSPQCTGTFSYERKPGRPPKACVPCRKTALVRVNVTRPQIAPTSRPTTATCGCGNKFEVKPVGRISTRCETCREDGTVWRNDEDGNLVRISGDQVSRELSREEQERKDAAGHERAKNLVERMKPLLEKKNRTVIMH